MKINVEGKLERDGEEDRKRWLDEIVNDMRTACACEARDRDKWKFRTRMAESKIVRLKAKETKKKRNKLNFKKKTTNLILYR